MPNLILTTTGWEGRIRSKLGVDEAYLPATEIQQPDFISVAEYNIIDLVPNYAELAGKDRIYLEAATVCECAQLICPTMPARLPTREQGPHVTTELTIDWEKKQKELQAERDVCLSKITIVADVPHFGLAGPNR